MKRLLVCALLASAMALPAYAAKKSGDMATDFQLRASLAGQEFDLAGSAQIQQLAPMIVDRILAIPKADAFMLTRLITKLAAGNAASKAAAMKSVAGSSS